MPLFKIDDLQAWTGGKWLNLPKKYPEIRGFSTDSRNIPENFAFVALIGERDGHDFIEDAVKNGASAVIASKETGASAPTLIVKDTLAALQTIAKLHRLRFESPVVGVTGSCGKTTTKEFLAKLLSWKKPLFTEGNLNNEIGVPLTLTRIDVRENMCAIVEAGVGAPGQMEPLAKMIEPDIAVITCVAPAHMERFGEISAIAAEKAALAANVAKGGWALFHSDLLSWKAFEELQCKKAALAPADGPEIRADLVFRYLATEEDGVVKIDMCVEGGNEYYFEMPVLTKGMTQNALLAIAAALMLGTTEEQLASRLPNLRAGAMRGSVVETEKSKIYADCYNASPAAMKDALRRFLSLSENSPRLFVLGTMGELGIAALRYHKEIGEFIPPSESSKAVLVGENAEYYKAGMLQKGWKEEDISIVQTSAEAKSAAENFEGWIFLKGSRVCELEKALPDCVLAKMSPAAAAPEPSEDEPIEAAEPEEPAPEADGENGGGYSEEFDSDEFGGDEIDEAEDDSDDDSDDDSEDGESESPDFEDDERF